MRRVIALLLSCFLIAATAEGGMLRCLSMTASLGGSHRCCDDEQALSPAASPCCFVSQASQPGPTESQKVASHAGAPCESSAVFVQAAGGLQRNVRVRPSVGSITSSVPIYLHHLSLLI
jgi:hypothetical protein